MPTRSLSSAANALYDVFGRAHRVRDYWNGGLAPEDAKLARAVLGLCLRRWGRLNAWHRPKLKEPSKNLPIQTQIAINIGLSQLAWLPGVAEYAAVSESVELLSHKKIGLPHHKGLVNAILRAASKDRGTLASELDSLPAALDRSPFSDRLLRAALHGRDTSENIEILWDRLQQPPQPAFVALKGPPPNGLVPDAQFPQARRLPPGGAFPLAWLESGDGMVQDISSQALMKFNWAFEKDGPVHILDICAAPGGKTTSLARMWPQAKIFAIEQNPSRAQTLRENLAARGIGAIVEVADSAAWLRACERPFDLILLDAPCSASGTIRKHPELNWIFKLQDLGRLTGIQAGLLDAAIDRLAPRGLLIYSVCSWFPEEGIRHLARLEEREPQVAPAPIWPDSQGAGTGIAHIFRPDPMAWDGEGFQGFAVTRLPR